MSDSNPLNPSSQRPILKLKTSRPKSLLEDKAPSSHSQSKLSQKPGAALSDELKRRTQEDMDALMSR